MSLQDDYLDLLSFLDDNKEEQQALERIWSHFCNTEVALAAAEEELKCYTDAIDRALARKP